ncbi:uncharacterized protein [Chelonus insularis]|uniref:uncharacterized protein n=1 Tax=Chelonus insularis TaxID=460826 RepID=UPI00158EAA29|nr:uncharacterized protein LOC118067696 [Chelonus insularis]
MNCLTLLFVLITLFSIKALALNPTEGITRLKNTVNSVSNDLTRYNNNLEFNLNMKLSNLKLTQMTNVNNAVNPALDDTRKAIAEAKKQGKYADHCYEPTRSLLADASKTAFRQLDDCVSDQLKTLQPVQQNINSHLLNGKLLLSKLDGIAISCASAGSPMNVQLCIAQKMPEANGAVQNYQSVANQLKSTGNSLSNAAEVDTIRCFQTPMSNLHKSVSSARISATTCIHNARSARNSKKY